MSVNFLPQCRASIAWRAVSWDDLRTHPKYVSLPNLEEVIYTASLSEEEITRATPKEEQPPIKSMKCEDILNTELDWLAVPLLRQDSPEWKAFRRGRLTGSSLAAFLGLYEKYIAGQLKIPSTQQGHDRVVNAWTELRCKPIRCPQEVLMASSSSIKEKKSREDMEEVMKIDSSVWGEPTEQFCCDYTPIPQQYQAMQRHWATHIAQNPLDIRLAWGKAQEATGILAALNWLGRERPTSRLLESGLLGVDSIGVVFQLALKLLAMDTLCMEKSSEASQPLPKVLSLWRKMFHESDDELFSQFCKSFLTLINSDNPKIARREAMVASIVSEIQNGSMPPLGASPDGVILNEDGSLTVLEVKCSSPFRGGHMDANGSSSTSTLHSNDKVYVTKREDFTPNIKPLPAWHFPQLQLEMFAAGVTCENALVTVMNYDSVEFYSVERDDDYLEAVFSNIHKTYKEFLFSVPSNRQRPPPANFANCSQMKHVATSTATLANRAAHLGILCGAAIQRPGPLSESFFI